MDKAMFMNLVMMLGTSVMQQLGKIVNPITNKAETDLAGAQSSISLLEMLRAKTKGNLDADESRLLDQTVSMVQMNYVETAANQPVSEEKKEEAAESAAEDAAAEEQPSKEDGPAAEESADKKPGEKKDPKYRKTYG
jgi:hypothetical protein